MQPENTLLGDAERARFDVLTNRRLAVDLSTAQARDAGLYGAAASAVAAAGLPARPFEREITKTTVLGVVVACDGTGHASPGHASAGPLTRLRIDREFVRDLRADPDDTAIVEAVIALGASLDVVAEDIGTPDQASALVGFGFGCREARGDRFGRPMAAGDFAAHPAAPVSRRSA